MTAKQQKCRDLTLASVAHAIGAWAAADHGDALLQAIDAMRSDGIADPLPKPIHGTVVKDGDAEPLVERYRRCVSLCREAMALASQAVDAAEPGSQHQQLLGALIGALAHVESRASVAITRTHPMPRPVIFPKQEQAPHAE